MFALSSISLFLYLVVIIYPPIVNFFVTYEYYDFTSKSVFFLNVLTSESNILYRNSGFASEPGLYQFLLNLALWWKLRQCNKIDFCTFIFIASIFTTNSTAGLLCMFLILFLSSKGRVRWFIVLCVIVALPIILPQLQYHITQKMVGSESFEGRFSPFLNAFTYSFSNPLGIGSVEYSAIYKELNIGGWDSFSQIVIRYGYQGLIFVLFFLVVLFLRSLTLGCLLLVSFFSQAIWFYPVVSCFYFWSFNFSKPKSNST